MRSLRLAGTSVITVTSWLSLCLPFLHSGTWNCHLVSLIAFFRVGMFKQAEMHQYCRDLPKLDLVLDLSIIACLLGLFNTERLAREMSAVTLVMDILLQEKKKILRFLI